MTESVKSQQLLSVQAFRAVGVSIIVFAHIAIAIFNTAYANASVRPEWIRWLYGCRSAIDMFFAFSGFIMVYIARDGFAKRDAASRFFLFRLTRIVPIYWIYTLLALFLGFILSGSGVQEGVGTQAPTFEALWKSLLFIPYSSSMLPIPNVDGITVYPALVVGWTLNYEIFFYTLFALCMRFSLRNGLIVLSGLALVLALVHLICPPDIVPIYFWTSATLWRFVIGAWVGYLFVKGVRFHKIPSWLAIGFCVIAYAGLFYLYMEDTTPDDLLFHAISSVLSALIGAGLVLTRLEYAKIPLWIVKIGDASYSTYLSHIFIVTLVFVPLYVFINPSIELTFAMGIFVYVLALYCGHMSYIKLELPIMSFFRERYKRQKLEKEERRAAV